MDESDAGQYSADFKSFVAECLRLNPRKVRNNGFVVRLLCFRLSPFFSSRVHTPTYVCVVTRRSQVMRATVHSILIQNLYQCNSYSGQLQANFLGIRLFPAPCPPAFSSISSQGVCVHVCAPSISVLDKLAHRTGKELLMLLDIKATNLVGTSTPIMCWHRIILFRGGLELHFILNFQRMHLKVSRVPHPAWHR